MLSIRGSIGGLALNKKTPCHRRTLPRTPARAKDNAILDLEFPGIECRTYSRHPIVELEVRVYITRNDYHIGLARASGWLDERFVYVGPDLVCSSHGHITNDHN